MPAPRVSSFGPIIGLNRLDAKSPKRSAPSTSGGPTPPTLCEIEADESFSLEDLMQELGRLEPQALGYVKHGDVPPREQSR